MFLFKKLCTNPIIKPPSIVPQNISNFSTIVKTLKDDIFTISLVGRPNVGKSSMFNKLAGGKFALTDSLPGLTRDRKEIVTKLFDVPVRLVDTAGWEDFKNVKDGEIKRKMMEQTAQGLIYSDLALFMFDAKNGITSEDIMLANWLRKRQMEKAELDSKVFPKMETLDDVRIKKILLVGNKVENSTELDIYGDVYKLGFGEPILVSAEHGDNMHELWDAIRNEIPDKNREEYLKKIKRRRQKHNEIKDLYRRELIELQENSENPHEINIREWEKEFDMFNKNPEENSDLDSDNDVDAKEALGTNFVNTSGGISADNFMKKKPIQITFAGRPNVGKSTLINSLLKENRIIADDLPGTTRDAISVQWVYKGKKVTLIDTAGLNKKAKLHSKVEQMMKTESIKAIQYSNIVVCVIDALDAFRIQDMSIAQYVVKEGRGIVIVVNKWDLVTQEWRTKASKFMYKQLERFLGETKNIPLYFVSGLTNYKTEEVMDAVLKTYESWNLRVSTGLLNDWLNRFKKTQDMPSENGEFLKIRFMTQIKSRPPTFSVFVNNRRLFKDNYLKYMKNSLTTEFGIQGVPVRFYIRDSGYKQEKRQIERIKKVGKIKNFFLKKRRLARHARMRLERLGRQPKSE